MGTKQGTPELQGTPLRPYKYIHRPCQLFVDIVLHDEIGWPGEESLTYSPPTAPCLAVGNLVRMVKRSMVIMHSIILCDANHVFRIRRPSFTGQAANRRLSLRRSSVPMEGKCGWTPGTRKATSEVTLSRCLLQGQVPATVL